MTRRDASALCGFGLAGGWLRAQEPAAPPEVSVTVVVRSATGATVPDLGLTDFAIEDSGLPQTVRSLSRGADTPLTVGLLMDTNESGLRMPERERRAAFHFLENLVNAPRHSAFVIDFSAYVDLRQYLTSSGQRLEAALQPGESSAFPARIQPPSGARLFDAVVRASQQCLQLRQGRKACVLLSAEIDSGSQATVEEAIESAQQAGSAVYVVLFFSARSFRFPHPAAARMLQRLAAETGGGYFEVSSSQPIERVFQQIGDELRGAYTLGYTPEPSGSGFRSIAVGLRRKDLIAQAPSRSYAAIGARQSPAVRIVRVEPGATEPGEVVTTSGDGLDQSNVSAVYLTDGVRTLPAETVEQLTTSIRFRVPEQAAAGPWVPGEKRPHIWNILLLTPGGDLLHYVGFQIAVE